MKIKDLVSLLMVLVLFIACNKTKNDIVNQTTNNKVRVTFQSNGGTSVAEISTEKDKIILEPTAPTKAGYKLEGWYKETSLTNKWDFGTDKVLQDLTLYAKWKEESKLNEEILVEKGIIETTIKVKIDKSFYIQKYEVTQSQFEELMGYNPSHFKTTTGETIPNNPVEMTTWYDAVMYANKLSEKIGLSPYYNISNIVYEEIPHRITKATVTENVDSKGYRLPTQQEWQYAAKGGNKSLDYNFSGSNDISKVAWYIDNSNKMTHEVGLKEDNELGIYDMTGNIIEWCNTGYGTGRIFMGGSFNSREEWMGIPFYDGAMPYAYGNGLGFRLVRTQ